MQELLGLSRILMQVYDLSECPQNDQASTWQNIPDYKCLPQKPAVETPH
jgi:hypothetical protein